MKEPRSGKNVYIMVDIESDGPIPGDFSMLALGAMVVDEAMDKNYYAELKPISERWKPEALSVNGFTRAQTLTFRDPAHVMREFAAWLESLPAGRLRFVSDNNGFDWQFVNWYFHHFLGKNPFGYSSINLKNLYQGLVKDAGRDFRHLRRTPHTHNALDDVKGNVEALLHMLKEMGLTLP